MPLDANGWTILEPAHDNITYYVSSTGSNSNDGLSEGSPLLTIAEARNRLRDGFADWILLRRGDTFTGVEWIQRSGRSASEPIVISSYGTGARPIITSRIYYHSNNFSPTYTLRYITFSGVHLQGNYVIADPETHGRAVELYGPRIQHITFEGCRIQDWRIGIHVSQATTATCSNYSLRRNVIFENAGQGVLISDVDTILLEENIFDNNGNGEDIGANIFNHNIYLYETLNVTLRGNILARGSNFGSKLGSDTPDGIANVVVENNLYYQNSFSLDHSAGITHDPEVAFTHRNVLVADNTFIDTYKLFGDFTQQDMAMYLQNMTEVEFRGNIFAHKTSIAANAIATYPTDSFHRDVSYNDNIVYDWAMNASYTDLPNQYFRFRPLVIDDYAESGNQYDLPAESYVDPNRSVGGYHASIGGTNNAIDFFAAARTMSKDNWDYEFTADAVNTYIRNGFQLPSTGIRYASLGSFSV